MTATALAGRSRWLRLAVVRDSAVVVAMLAFLPLVLDEFRLRTIGGYFGFAVVALSLDLVWGYTGIISFGQGAFFGVGAYAVALALTHLNSPLAAAAGAVAGIVGAALIALVLGWFVFNRRVGRFYVAIFTLALSVLAQQLVIELPNISGGANGIVISQQVIPANAVAAYYVMLAVLAVVLLTLVWLTQSDFGRLLVAVRDNEERARFLGYDTAKIQRWAFVMAGALAAVGGICYATYSQLASPDLVGFQFSTLLLIWVAIGGRGSLVGAVLGTLLVNIASEELSADLLHYWQLVLGASFIATVLLFPDGLYSLARRIARRLEPHQPLQITLRSWTRFSAGALAAGTVLEVAGLGKSFGTFRALDSVDLKLERGQLLCLIGPNGAGKSTLVDVLSGRILPTQGTAAMLDRPMVGRSPDWLALAGVGRKFQTTNVFDTISVGENLLLAGLAEHFSARALLRRTHRIELPEPVVSLLQESALLGRLDRLASRLSHGEKQWLELSMVLASEPMLVLLDEPTAGLTAVERREIGAVLRRLTDQGVAVMTIEHDFDFVREVADRVIVLHQGRVIAQGTVLEVSHNRTVREVYLGLMA